MAVTIDWLTKTINVPRADMLVTQVSPEIRQLDVNAFRLELKAIEESIEGIVQLTTHNHNPPVTVAGTVLARVVEIINGYSVTFEDGQYRVVLVGANNNILDVANLNQVSIAPTNSAGLQDLNSLQAASFDGVVSIDVTSIYDSTNFPVGTRSFPVNNVADAILIAEERGIRTINVMTSMTFSTGDFSDGYVFRSDNPAAVMVTLDPGTDVTNCEFVNLSITGTLDGANTVRDCVVDNLNYVNGFLVNSAISGTITLGGNEQASLFDCWSNVAGGGSGRYVIIDMGGSGQSLAMRGYSGGVEIINSVGPSDSSIDMFSGRVLLASSLTGGDFTIRGNAKVVDDSAGANIQNQTINKAIESSQFGGAITIDTTSSFTGTDFPVGTDEQPVNNLTDALSISTQRGIDRLHFISDYTFTTGDDVSFKELVGHGYALTALTFPSGVATVGTRFEDCTLSGTLVSPTGFERVHFEAVTGNTVGAAGRMEIRNSTFGGTVTLSNSLIAEIDIISCSSSVPGGGDAVFDTNGADVDVFVAKYSGNMEIRGFSLAGKYMKIHNESGHVTIDPSCTNGDIEIYGQCEVIDNNGGSVVHDDTTSYRLDRLIEDLEGELVTTSTLNAQGDGTGTMVLYTDATRTTIIRQWTTVYSGFAVTERIPV